MVRGVPDRRRRQCAARHSPQHRRLVGSRRPGQGEDHVQQRGCQHRFELSHRPASIDHLQHPAQRRVGERWQPPRGGGGSATTRSTGRNCAAATRATRLTTGGTPSQAGGRWATPLGRRHSAPEPLGRRHSTRDTERWWFAVNDRRGERRRLRRESAMRSSACSPAIGCGCDGICWRVADPSMIPWFDGVRMHP